MGFCSSTPSDSERGSCNFSHEAKSVGRGRDAGVTSSRSVAPVAGMTIFLRLTA